MTDRSKKILLIGCVSLVMASQIFATTNVKMGNESTIDLGFVKQAVNLIVGIFAGGYTLLKAALDIFHAVRNSSEDSNALKKAIGNFVLNAAILGGFMFVINYVFGGMSDVENGADITNFSAQQVFFGALSGSLISPEYLIIL